MSDLVFHLIPNAHLDPVWLWDWREGLNEGLITCRTILDLMDEEKSLTFIRGESAIYEHIERTDPKTFARIKKYVKNGRWDVVGGTVIQPDTNLPDAETFARHFLHGQRYFQTRFGKTSRVAWAADSFGHSAGLPEILAAGGIEYFAFTRPANNIVPIDSPAFWWEGPGDSRVLAYRPLVGWYGSEREEMNKRLDAYLDAAMKSPLGNVGCFFGLGNHGGGPTRRHLQEIRDWAKQHRQVRVIFSGLHKFFDALKREVAKSKLAIPTHRGELNFVLRGCYSSVAKFKFAYRKTEALLQRAERTDAIVRHGRDGNGAQGAWNTLLFNSFHDILPGSSIERAMDEQIAQLGGAQHAALSAEFDALNALASQVDTRVHHPEGDNPCGVSLLVWNPHPHAYNGPIELEASLDYRPVWKYHKNVDAMPVRVSAPDGSDQPFQLIETEHHAMVDLAWRKRVIVDANLPAFGWNVFEMAYDEDADVALVETLVRAREHEITNGIYTVRAATGSSGVEVLLDGQSIFAGLGLGVVTVDDPWGSWGAMAEEPESLNLTNIRHQWKITDVRVLEKGPLRASMWVKFEGGNSRLELTFLCSHARQCVDVSARVLWNERSARLKLVMPCGDRATFEVPGATIDRDPNLGEVPGGRWVRVSGPRGDVGFASDSLYNFDCTDGTFRATVCRASRYADDVKTYPRHEPWRAAVDAGELKFKFLLAGGDVQELSLLARHLEQPPVVLPVPPHGREFGGKLGRSGSLGELKPDTLKLMALKRAADGKGLVLRVQETAGRATSPKLTLFGRPVRLTKVPAHQIVTWRLMQASRGGGWKAKLTDATELG